MAQVEEVQQVGMPLADFIARFGQQPFEIISGERRDKMPGVFGPSEIINRLYRLLLFFLDQHPLGEVLAETTFVLPDADNPNWVKGSRIPDVMFIAGQRLEAYKAAQPDFRERPLALVPDLVVEVISPTDKVVEVDHKIDLYLADGVKVVWALNPGRGKAVLYYPDRQPLHLAADDVLEGGDLLPSFAISLKELYR